MDKDKIIKRMAEYIEGLDIDEDICRKVECSFYTGEKIKCTDCIIKFFIQEEP